MLVLKATVHAAAPSVDQAEDRLRSAAQPYVDALAGTMTPLKERLSFPSLQQPADPDGDFARITQALRAKLSGR